LGIVDDLSPRIIGLAIEVHRHLGPGLLEAAYEECLAYELRQAGLTYRRQVPLAISYKDVQLDASFRLDIVVEDALILEIKAVEKLTPLHEAQLLTYLKLSKIRVGLLMNFNVPTLKSGLKRLAA
jgi:GxxExxY protein